MRPRSESMTQLRLSSSGRAPLGPEWRRRSGAHSGPNGTSTVRRAGESWHGAHCPERTRQPYRRGSAGCSNPIGTRPLPVQRWTPTNAQHAGITGCPFYLDDHVAVAA
jgi:hypothetical protein